MSNYQKAVEQSYRDAIRDLPGRGGGLHGALLGVATRAVALGLTLTEFESDLPVDNGIKKTEPKEAIAYSIF